MGNIVKKEAGQAQQGLTSRDPFQTFMRNPFQTMREMITNPFGPVGWSPDFDVRETADVFVIKADIPGLQQNDLEISLTGNQLAITGRREAEQEESEGQYYTYERSYGQFKRTFALPDSADLDKISSDLKDGVLTLVVPKKSGAAQQTRKIQVGAGQKS